MRNDATLEIARRRRRFRVVPYVILAPVFLLLAVMAYYPALNGIWHSFYEWNPGFQSDFIGFANYAALLNDSIWWSSFRNLAIIFLVSVTFMWAVPLLAAELVITLRHERARFVFRTLLIAPLAFPSVVTALIWSFMYNPNDGVINHFLEAIGLGALAHNWVGDPATALGALIFIGFPWIAGLPFLVFLAALQDIPAEVFEAAALDGVGRWRRFIYIDLPMMLNQVRLLLFLVIISTLQYGFAAYLVTGGGPDNSTMVPVLRMIGTAFQGQQWGRAAAMGTVLFLMALAASGIVFFRRRGQKGGNVD